jgi:hypothetical protein
VDAYNREIRPWPLVLIVASEFSGTHWRGDAHCSSYRHVKPQRVIPAGRLRARRAPIQRLAIAAVLLLSSWTLLWRELKPE